MNRLVLVALALVACNPEDGSLDAGGTEDAGPLRGVVVTVEVTTLWPDGARMPCNGDIRIDDSGPPVEFAHCDRTADFTYLELNGGSTLRLFSLAGCEISPIDLEVVPTETEMASGVARRTVEVRYATDPTSCGGQ